MVRLESEGTVLDLFDNEPINLNINVQNIRDIGKVYAPISKEFTLPATDRNNRFFKHYYNVNVSGGFNANARTPAQLYADSEQIISGYIELLSCTIENENPKQYSILIASSTPNLAKVLEGKTLPQLSLSGIPNQVYNRTQILSTWADSVASGRYTFRFSRKKKLSRSARHIKLQIYQLAQLMSNEPLKTTDFLSVYASAYYRKSNYRRKRLSVFV